MLVTWHEKAIRTSERSIIAWEKTRSQSSSRRWRHTSTFLLPIPTTTTIITRTQTRNPEYGTRNTEYGIRNTEYGIRNPKPRTQNAEPEMPIPQTYHHAVCYCRHAYSMLIRLRNWHFCVECGIWDLEYGTRNPEPGTRNTEHGIRNTEHGTWNPILILPTYQSISWPWPWLLNFDFKPWFLPPSRPSQIYAFHKIDTTKRINSRRSWRNEISYYYAAISGLISVKRVLFFLLC